MSEHQNKIQTEMSYTTWDESCKDPLLTEDNDLRECRRTNRHDEKHASGFGNSFKEW